MSGEGMRGRWRNLRVGGASAPAPEAREPVASASPEIDGTPKAGDAGPPAPAIGFEAGTFIGTGALFSGKLELKGDFRIDSEFRGELCTDGCVEVGPDGSVEGDIHAREVVVRGAVVGHIVARRELRLCAGSRLHGNIETACLELERHAFFQGSTQMTRPQAQSRQRLPATPAL